MHYSFTFDLNKKGKEIDFHSVQESYALSFVQDFFNKADASETKANKTDSADDPAEVAERGYDALVKGEHRAYGSTKVKLMVSIGHILPNELVTKVTRTFMKEDK